MSEIVLIAAYCAVIAEGVLIIFLLRSWKSERTELIKLIAAKSYGEYESYNARDGKPPPRDRKSMIDRQQKKMAGQHEKGDTG